MNIARFFLCAVAALPFYSLAATAPFPTVKVVGDSISKGYLPTVQKLLHGKFEVSHACGNPKLTNCNNGQTNVILNNINSYFVSGAPDIVTFNSGIHDMSKALTALKMPCSVAKEMTPPEKYYQNLSKIADYLKDHAKKVIWIDTTTLPASMCASSHLEQYNSIGEKVAQEHNFYILRIDSKYHDKSGIHFTSNGYAALGKQVSECIALAWSDSQSKQCFRK